MLLAALIRQLLFKLASDLPNYSFHMTLRFTDQMDAL